MPVTFNNGRHMSFCQLSIERVLKESCTWIISKFSHLGYGTLPNSYGIAPSDESDIIAPFEVCHGPRITRAERSVGIEFSHHSYWTLYSVGMWKNLSTWYIAVLFYCLLNKVTVTGYLQVYQTRHHINITNKDKAICSVRWIWWCY